MGQAAVAHEDVAIQQQLQLAGGKLLEGRFKTYCSSCCFRSISTFKSKTKMPFDINEFIIYISQHDEEDRTNW